MTARTPWTPEEDAILRQGIADKKPMRHIAAMIEGRTSKMTSLRAERLGIRVGRNPKDAIICPISASAELRDRLEASFANFSRKHKVDYLDARTMLMNCAGL